MVDSVTPINAVPPDMQADRDQAIELARQIRAGEVQAEPFDAADYLTSMPAVLAYVGDLKETDELATIVSVLATAHCAAMRILEEEMRK